MRCARKRKHFCETCIPSITGRNVFNPLSRSQELFTSLFSVAWIFSIFSVGILSWNKSSGIFLAVEPRWTPTETLPAERWQPRCLCRSNGTEFSRFPHFLHPAQLDPLMLRSSAVGNCESCENATNFMIHHGGLGFRAENVWLWLKFGRVDSTQNKHMKLILIWCRFSQLLKYRICLSSPCAIII